MKVKVDREVLFSKISKMIKFIPAKQIIPAFENFKITVENGIMEIVAADSAMQCKMKMKVSSKDSFSICIPAKLFVKTIGLFRENEVIITAKSETKIELKSGKSKYNITSDCLSKDFPNMLMNSSESEITLSQQLLKTSFKSAQKFINEDGANSNIIGINIQEVDTKIVFTGLDDKTMCRAAVSPISIFKWESVVCPTDTAQRVTSLLDDKGEVVLIHSGDKIKIFTNEESDDFFEVTSVSANAKFPNSEMLFKKMSADYYLINTAELLDAVKRLKLYTPSEETPVISFKTLSDAELDLNSVDNNLNKDGNEVVSYANHSSIKLDKSFNADNFIKILSIFDANDFRFYFAESKNHPSFIVPNVATKEEEIYSFLLTSML